MARTLGTGLEASIEDRTSGVDVIRLVELEHSGGTVRWTTAAADVLWNSVVWTAVGGSLALGDVVESAELKGPGLTAAFSGVDSAVISVVMSNQFRGYPVSVWRAHLVDGDIAADPLLEFRGFQNDDYLITDSSNAEGGTVAVRTRWVPRTSILRARNVTMTSLHSHRELLRRAGLTGTDLDDSFFARLPGLAGKKAIRWGSESPASLGTEGGGPTTGRETPEDR